MWRVLKAKANRRKKAVVVAVGGEWPRYEVQIESMEGRGTTLSCSQRAGPGQGVRPRISHWAFPSRAWGALAWLILRYRLGDARRVPVTGLQGAFKRDESIREVSAETLEQERQAAILDGRRLELEEGAHFAMAEDEPTVDDLRASVERAIDSGRVTGAYENLGQWIFPGDTVWNEVPYIASTLTPFRMQENEQAYWTQAMQDGYRREDILQVILVVLQERRQR